VTKIADINYQPLEAVPDTLFSSKMGYKKILHGKTLLALIAAIVGFIASMVIVVVNKNLGSVGAGVFVITVLPFGILVSLALNVMEEDAWLQFAAANNWQIDSISDPFFAPGLLSGINPQFSNNLVNLPILKAEVDSISCDIFNTYVTTHDNRSLIISAGSAAATYCLIAHSTLPQRFPYMIIKSKAGGIPSIFWDGDATDVINMEFDGDLGKYFEMNVLASQEDVAMQLLTANITQAMVQLSQMSPFQIVIYDNNIWIINSNLTFPYTKKLAEQLLLATSQITAQLSVAPPLAAAIQS
jgi:hypothetical protein